MTGFALPAGPAAPCQAEPSGVEARRVGWREHLASATRPAPRRAIGHRSTQIVTEEAEGFNPQCGNPQPPTSNAMWHSL